MARAYYNETQRFRHWWIYLVILISVASWFYALVSVLNEPQPEDSDGILTVIIAGVVPLLLVAMLFALRLETRIRDEGLYVRFKPIQFKEKHIKLEDVNSFEVRKYRPLAEYGGWGIRSGGKKYGKAYNVSGNMGLQLYLKNGKKLLIGTQKPREIEKAMKSLMEGERLTVDS